MKIKELIAEEELTDSELVARFQEILQKIDDILESDLVDGLNNGPLDLTKLHTSSLGVTLPKVLFPREAISAFEYHEVFGEIVATLFQSGKITLKVARPEQDNPNEDDDDDDDDRMDKLDQRDYDYTVNIKEEDDSWVEYFCERAQDTLYA